MNVLILLESKQEQNLAKVLKENPQINVEINNIDFNLTNSINRAQVIIFFGDNLSYDIFMSSYREQVVNKLIIRNCDNDIISSSLDIVAVIDSGVLVCKVPELERELEYVVIQSLQTIFEPTLKILICNEQDYGQMLDTVNTFKQELVSLTKQYDKQLSLPVVEQILRNVNVN